LSATERQKITGGIMQLTKKARLVEEAKLQALPTGSDVMSLLRMRRTVMFSPRNAESVKRILNET
jgi:hypothetical protein